MTVCRNQFAFDVMYQGYESWNVEVELYVSGFKSIFFFCRKKIRDTGVFIYTFHACKSLTLKSYFIKSV
jgi:hypothetical protein